MIEINIIILQVYESSSKEEWSLPAYSYRANSKYYHPWGKNYIQ